jgi:hypothetical protein
MSTENEMNAFIKHLTERNLSNDTKNQYKKYLSSYVKKYGGFPVGDQADIYRNIENLVLEKANGKPIKSTKSQTLKAICSYRNYKNLPRDELVRMFADVNQQASDDAKKRNAEASTTLPSLKEHNEWVDKLYDLNDPEKLRKYVINKLLMNCYVRNRDLVATIITKKTDLKKIGENENYLHLLNKPKNQVSYGRRDYKTAKKYGEKITTCPTNKGDNIRFVKALRIVLKNSPNKNIIPDNKQDKEDDSGRMKSNKLHKYIIEATNGLGETKLLKMSLKENNTLADASKIGESRGTALGTLQQNYNIVQ